MKIWQKYLGVEDAQVEDYHRLARRELTDLFTSPRKRVIEIGCAAGYTGKHYKEQNPGVDYWGFELNKAAAREAITHLDRVVCGKFEEQHLDVLGLAPQSVDGVVLGDVLEHMYDPWRALTALTPWLSEDAEVVVSLPNVRNLWLLNEIAEGRFTYGPYGLLDITHIRFFTTGEIHEMMESTGYTIVAGGLMLDENLVQYHAQAPRADGPCVFHYKSISVQSTGNKLTEFCSKQFMFRATLKKSASTRIGTHRADLLAGLQSDHDAAFQPDPVHHVAQLAQAPATRNPCEVYAFYLPQFHPTEQNSAWWGEGFTEWSNVSRARPAFNGHYQPRHPGALGHYDLRVAEVMNRQVALAKQAGLAGFIFYYYWFSGQRMLDMPMRAFMDRYAELDMPFMVMWCNENWKRTWLDGSTKGEDLLMEHKHLPDDPERFIDDLADVLAHPGYVRMDGKPILLVYPLIGVEGTAPPEAIPPMVERWRARARALGLGELCIGGLQWPTPLPNGQYLAPAQLGLDFFFEFPPNHVWTQRPIANHNASYQFYRPDHNMLVAHYEDVVERSRGLPDSQWPLVKTVIAGTWDNSARKSTKAHVYHGATPTLYQRWLSDSMQYARRRPALAGKPMVFVNAWNEWAEGAYLEPDRRFGYGYLAATQRAITGTEEEPTEVQPQSTVAK